MTSSERIIRILSEKRIKLHLFEPSMRKVWTIVGANNEHWIYPENDFCSCAGFHFRNLEGKGFCYHLDAVKKAKETGEYETVLFSDDEFDFFIKSFVSDLYAVF